MNRSFLPHCTCILAVKSISSTQITLNILHLINAHSGLFAEFITDFFKKYGKFFIFVSALPLFC